MNEDASAAFNNAMDEFLLEKQDLLFIEGTKLRKGMPKGLRSDVTLPTGDVAVAGALPEEEEVEVDAHIAAIEQNTLQQATEEVLLRMKHDALHKDRSIETCQAYLQEVRIEEEWDCESILSTYSTLDNHPTVIKDTNSKFRKYKSPHQRSLDAEAAAASNMSSAGSVASRNSRMTKSVISKGPSIIYGTPAALAAANAKYVIQFYYAGERSNPFTKVAFFYYNYCLLRATSSAPGKIVLSGRLNLPEGFGPSQYEKRKEMPQRSLDSSTMQVQVGLNNTPSTEPAERAPLKVKVRGGKKGKQQLLASSVGGALANIAEGTESESDDEDRDGEGRSGSSDDGSGSDDDRTFSRSIARKRRQETPEEKKARKEAVKEERRNKRLGKKELKTAFKAEGSKIIRSVGNEQSIDHVSVFRY